MLCCLINYTGSWHSAQPCKDAGLSQRAWDPCIQPDLQSRHQPLIEAGTEQEDLLIGVDKRSEMCNDIRPVSQVVSLRSLKDLCQQGQVSEPSPCFRAVIPSHIAPDPARRIGGYGLIMDNTSTVDTQTPLLCRNLAGSGHPNSAVQWKGPCFIAAYAGLKFCLPYM